VVNRNKQWKDQATLLSADMKYLENSVRANELMGIKLKQGIEIELAKQVNVAKFLMPNIRKSIRYFEKATEIYPGHISSWMNMGELYNHPRIAEHLMAKGDTNEYSHFKKSALSSFKRVLSLDPEEEEALFNLGYTYEGLGMLDSAIYYYELCINYNPKTIYPRSKLANIKFMQGMLDEALELNRQIIYIAPNEAIPYLNFGNYYMLMGDTLKSVMHFEKAALLNARPEVYAFLAQYYSTQGNDKKAMEYTKKYNVAIGSQ
jgi:tetratricopeptide (TPR) repeat protein